MQIYKIARDLVPSRARFDGGAFHDGTLSGVPATVTNPYPGGIPVSGQGPGGQNWPLQWSFTTGFWVAVSPFNVVFPLWTDANFGAILKSIDDDPTLGPYYSYGDESGNRILDMIGYEGYSALPVPAATYARQLGKRGTMFVQVDPSKPGTQNATYDLDQSTGLYRPVSVAGSNNLGQMSLLDSFGIFVGLATAVIGGAALIAPAAAPTVASAADVAATGATADVAAATAPEIAGFTVPTIPAAAPLDLAAMPAVDVASISGAAATAATSPLSQVFSIANYIKQLAGAYSTVKSLTQLTGGAAAHPQAGAIMRLPDGSTSVVNPDGSITVTQPNGAVTTVGAGGVTIPGPVPYAPPVQQAGFGGVGAVVMGLSILGYLLSR